MMLLVLALVILFTGGAFMAAIDNLETAVGRLTAAVDAAVAKLSQPPSPDEARVQAAADAVNAQAARLEDASA